VDCICYYTVPEGSLIQWYNVAYKHDLHSTHTQNGIKTTVDLAYLLKVIFIHVYDIKLLHLLLLILIYLKYFIILIEKKI